MVEWTVAIYPFDRYRCSNTSVSKMRYPYLGTRTWKIIIKLMSTQQLTQIFWFQFLIYRNLHANLNIKRYIDAPLNCSYTIFSSENFWKKEVRRLYLMDWFLEKAWLKIKEGTLYEHNMRWVYRKFSSCLWVCPIEFIKDDLEEDRSKEKLETIKQTLKLVFLGQRPRAQSRITKD